MFEEEDDSSYFSNTTNHHHQQQQHQQLLNGCLSEEENKAAKEFFADFADLDEIEALEEGDLSLLSDPMKVRQLNDALSSNGNMNGGDLNNSADALLNAFNLATQNDGQMGFGNGDKQLEDELSLDNHLHQSIKTEAIFQPNSNGNGMAYQKGAENNNNNNYLHSFGSQQQEAMAPPQMLPPVVISPADIDTISVQLEKNQQCACKDCGKLFNSVWYLKQHAVKHSNDRPFKCKFCFKTYKFRSNLYQHKCPERNRHMGVLGNGQSKRFYTRGIAYTEMYNKNMSSAPSTNTAAAGDEQTVKANNGQQRGGGDSSGFSNNSNSLFGSNMQGLENGFDHSQRFSSMIPNDQSQMFFGPNGGNGQPINLFGSFSDIDQMSALGQPNSNGFSSGEMGSLFPGSMQAFGGPLDPSQPSNLSEPLVLDCIRDKPLDPDYIEAYLAKNRSRVFPCRKCKLTFPSREYLSRHMAYHSSLDGCPFACDQCPQRFRNEKQLSNHFLQHSDNSPHRCSQCFGTFRSALALRRHRDQCRQCYCPPFGVHDKLMVSPSAPLDQYSFVGSEDEMDHETYSTIKNEDHEDPIKQLLTTSSILRKNTVDSGLGSDCSGQSFTGSPTRTTSTFEEDLLGSSFQMPCSSNSLVGIKQNRLMVPAKSESPSDPDSDEAKSQQSKNSPDHQPDSSASSCRVKDDETDSGFRSRLNSSATQQSCSPPSSISSTVYSDNGGGGNGNFGNGSSPVYRKISPPVATTNRYASGVTTRYGSNNNGGTSSNQYSSSSGNKRTRRASPAYNHDVSIKGAEWTLGSNDEECVAVRTIQHRFFNLNIGPKAMLMDQDTLLWQEEKLGDSYEASTLDSDENRRNERNNPETDVDSVEEKLKELVGEFWRCLLAVFLDALFNASAAKSARDKSLFEELRSSADSGPEEDGGDSAPKVQGEV